MKRLSKNYQITPEGHQKLQQELDHLLQEKETLIDRQAENPRHDRDFLVENNDVFFDHQQLSLLEERISELSDTLQHAKIVHSPESENQVVNIGNQVTVKNGRLLKFYIVGDHESNPLQNKISYRSPLGQALLGHSAGSTVPVHTPTGLHHYRIVNIH